MHLFFFLEQKTAYEMRISDWSSDVCSSDLAAEPGREILVRLAQRLQQLRVVGGRAVRGPALGLVERGGKLVDVSAGAVLTQLQVRLREQEIGTASCRERVC